MKTKTHALLFRRYSQLIAGLALVVTLLTGCPRTDTPAGSAAHGSSGDGATDEPITNRIAIPAEVRRNLGITFVSVEKRRVADAIRVPGRFEIDPAGVREYRLPLGGRIVDLAVAQYAPVKPLALLFRLDSPEWRALQEQLGHAEADVSAQQASLKVTQAHVVEAQRAADLMHDRLESLQPVLDAIDRHQAALEITVALWQDHIAELERLHGAGGGRATQIAEARLQMSTVQTERAQIAEERAEVEAKRIDLTIQEAELRNTLPRLEAEVAAQDVALANAHEHLKVQMLMAADIVGLTPAELAVRDDGGTPRWRAINSIEVRANAAGVVQTEPMPEGAWLSANELVVRTVNPAALRFRAIGLQSDLGRLRDDMSARIVPPFGGSLAMDDAMTGPLRIALEADADARTVDLLVQPTALAAWARPQVAAFLEIETSAKAEALAIPEAAIVTDGLDRVYFLRDYKDKDKVIRTIADLGVSDGRWVEVKSGVIAGDEVVLAGVYELKLTGSGKAPEGGHFHADGTFHAGADH